MKSKTLLYTVFTASVFIMFFQNCSSSKWLVTLDGNKNVPESTNQDITHVPASTIFFFPELSIINLTTNNEILTSSTNNSISLTLSVDSHFALKIKLQESTHLDKFVCKWTFTSVSGELQFGDCKEYVDHSLELKSPIQPGVFKFEITLNEHSLVRYLKFNQNSIPPPPLPSSPDSEIPPETNSTNPFSTINDSTYTSNFQIVPNDLQWTSQAGEKTGYLGLQGHVYTGYIGGPGWIPESWVTLDPGESVRIKIILPPGLSIGMITGEMPTVIGTLCAVYDQDLPLNQIDQSKLVLKNYRVSIELKAASSGVLKQPKIIYVVCYQRPSDMIYPHQWSNFTTQFLIKDPALFEDWLSKNK